MTPLEAAQAVAIRSLHAELTQWHDSGCICRCFSDPCPTALLLDATEAHLDATGEQETARATTAGA